MKIQTSIRYGLLLVLCFTCVACARQNVPSGPRAWIDAPQEGWVALSDTDVQVISHAYVQEGVTEGVLYVNGSPYARSTPKQSGTLVEFNHQWHPSQEGDYLLHVNTYSPAGAVIESDDVHVRVLARPSATPPASSTPTSVGAPDLTVVRVEAIVAGYKDDVPFCNTHVVLSNAGTVSVPNAFSIRFLYDGTPILENSMAGGLPPGGTAETTFVYQFIGTPPIGVNLDSTNLVLETNELNNAFAGALMCAGTPTAIRPTATLVPSRTYTPTFTGTLTPSPVPSNTSTPTATPSPSPVPTNTPTATRSATAVPTNTPTPTPAPPVVNFRADMTELIRGQCTTLRWDVDNVTAVYLDGQGVAGHSTRQVCPAQTTTYQLHIEAPAANLDSSLTIQVSEPPDTTPPPVPDPRVPQDGLAINCRTTQTLAWLPVTDESGIKGYYVKLERATTPGNWQSVRGWGPLPDKQVSASVECGGKYRWAVRAADNAGNISNWSAWSAFSIQLP